MSQRNRQDHSSITPEISILIALGLVLLAMLGRFVSVEQFHTGGCSGAICGLLSERSQAGAVGAR
jgi:hypothetical protein